MRTPFEYAVIRAVPRVQRGEQINVGVLLYCQARDFLAARTHVDAERLRCLDPAADLDAVREAVRSWEATCAGPVSTGPPGPPARSPLPAPGAGAERMRPGERFRWLTSPRSTVVQPGPVHTGLTDDPAAELDRLFDALVR